MFRSKGDEQRGGAGQPAHHPLEPSFHGEMQLQISGFLLSDSIPRAPCFFVCAVCYRVCHGKQVLTTFKLQYEFHKTKVVGVCVLICLLLSCCWYRILAGTQRGDWCEGINLGYEEKQRDVSSSTPAVWHGKAFHPNDAMWFLRMVLIRF